MSTLRLIIAERLLGFAMCIAPPGTDEKLEIVEFCCAYFGKRIKERK
jgi:hypothetical protein